MMSLGGLISIIFILYLGRTLTLPKILLMNFLDLLSGDDLIDSYYLQPIQKAPASSITWPLEFFG